MTDPSSVRSSEIVALGEGKESDAPSLADSLSLLLEQVTRDSAALQANCRALLTSLQAVKCLATVNKSKQARDARKGLRRAVLQLASQLDPIVLQLNAAQSVLAKEPWLVEIIDTKTTVNETDDKAAASTETEGKIEDEETDVPVFKAPFCEAILVVQATLDAGAQTWLNEREMLAMMTTMNSLNTQKGQMVVLSREAQEEADVTARLEDEKMLTLATLETSAYATGGTSELNNAGLGGYVMAPFPQFFTKQAYMEYVARMKLTGPRFYTSMVTNEYGKQRYVSVLHWYVGQHNVSTDFQYYTATAYVIVSEHEHFLRFREILMWLYRLHTHHPAKPVALSADGDDTLLKARAFLDAVTSTPVHGVLKGNGENSKVGNGTTRASLGSYEFDLNIAHAAAFSFDLVFSHLVVVDCVQIWTSLLLEQRVIFHSAQTELLYPFIHLFLSLLQPFQWTHPVIALPPFHSSEQTLDLLQSPFPFVLALPTKLVPDVLLLRSRGKKSRAFPDDSTLNRLNLCLVDIDDYAVHRYVSSNNIATNGHANPKKTKRNSSRVPQDMTTEENIQPSLPWEILDPLVKQLDSLTGARRTDILSAMTTVNDDSGDEKTKKTEIPLYPTRMMAFMASNMLPPSKRNPHVSRVLEEEPCGLLSSSFHTFQREVRHAFLNALSGVLVGLLDCVFYVPDHSCLFDSEKFFVVLERKYVNDSFATYLERTSSLEDPMLQQQQQQLQQPRPSVHGAPVVSPVLEEAKYSKPTAFAVGENGELAENNGDHEEEEVTPSKSFVRRKSALQTVERWKYTASTPRPSESSDGKHMKEDYSSVGVRDFLRGFVNSSMLQQYVADRETVSKESDEARIYAFLDDPDDSTMRAHMNEIITRQSVTNAVLAPCPQLDDEQDGALYGANWHHIFAKLRDMADAEKTQALATGDTSMLSVKTKLRAAASKAITVSTFAQSPEHEFFDSYIYRLLGAGTISFHERDVPDMMRPVLMSPLHNRRGSIFTKLFDQFTDNMDARHSQNTDDNDTSTISKLQLPRTPSRNNNSRGSFRSNNNAETKKKVVENTNPGGNTKEARNRTKALNIIRTAWGRRRLVNFVCGSSENNLRHLSLSLPDSEFETFVALAMATLDHCILSGEYVLAGRLLTGARLLCKAGTGSFHSNKPERFVRSHSFMSAMKMLASSSLSPLESVPDHNASAENVDVRAAMWLFNKEWLNVRMTVLKAISNHRLWAVDDAWVVWLRYQLRELDHTALYIALTRDGIAATDFRDPLIAQACSLMEVVGKRDSTQVHKLVLRALQPDTESHEFQQLEHHHQTDQTEDDEFADEEFGELMSTT